MDVEFLKHRFEDGYDGVITKKRFKIGVRHVQILYMFVCSGVFGALRGCAGVSILAITDATRRNDTYIQIHDWDRRIQGTILSSFFFGYALMLVPTELFLRRFGGKFAITVALVLNGTLCVAMPTIVDRGGWIAVCNAQFLMGLTQAWLSPAHRYLLHRWLPPNERNIFSSVVYSGVHFGILIALPISGMLSDEPLGWELIFYSQAMLVLSMAVMWALLTSGSPDQHQAVGDTEKEYIKETLNYYRKKQLRKPWFRIMRSPMFWAVTSSHVASNAIFIFYLTEIPAYLLTFGISLKESSWRTMLPFVSMWIVNTATAPSIEWVYKFGYINYIINITQYRKIINTLGAFGTIIGLAILSNLNGGSTYLATLILIGTLSLLGIQFSGFLETHKDMSQNFSGILIVMSSAVASFVGALVPLISGLIIKDNITDHQNWRIVFLCLAILYLVCNLVYTFFGSSERQDWDDIRVKDKFGYHNSTLDTNLLEMEEMCQTKIPAQLYCDNNDHEKFDTAM